MSEHNFYGISAIICVVFLVLFSLTKTDENTWFAKLWFMLQLFLGLIFFSIRYFINY